jgi:hypothetical protein
VHDRPVAIPNMLARVFSLQHSTLRRLLRSRAPEAASRRRERLRAPVQAVWRSLPFVTARPKARLSSHSARTIMMRRVALARDVLILYRA